MSNFLTLAARLSLDGTRFKAGLKEAEGAANKFSKDIGSSLKGELAAVFGAGALVAMVKGALSETAALQDLAEQSQRTTDEVQKLSAAAQDSGLEFNDIATAQRKFATQRREAAEGNKELRDEFEKFGFTLDDLNDPEKNFINFLESAQTAMSKMTLADKTKAIAEMTDMLGKTGSKLSGFLNALDEHKIDSLIHPEVIAELDRAGDSMGQLWRNTKNVIATTTAGFLRLPDVIGDMVWGGRGKTAEDRDRELKMSSSEIGKATPGKPLYEDKAKSAQDAKEAAALLKDKLDLEKGILEYQLKQMSAKERTVFLEQEMRNLLLTVGEKQGRFGEGGEVDITPERKAALDLLGKLPDSKQSRGDQSSLARVGQWQGINYQNTGENATVKAVKELLAPARQTAEGIQKIAAAPAKTINAGLR